MYFLKKFLICLLFLLFTFNLYAGTISPELEDLLSRSNKDDLIPVILKFKVDKTKINKIKKGDRGKLIKSLKNEHIKVKEKIKNIFEILGIRKFNELWHVKSFAFLANPEAIKKLADLLVDGEIKLDSVIYAPTFETNNQAINEWNIDLIGAKLLWDLNIKGQGVVVANLDSGVDYTHPDLISKWRGGNNSWFDPYGAHNEPYDASGHGTGTMGIIVGGNFSGTNIGIAPDAKWISAKIFNDSGQAQISKIHQAFAWILDPDGDPDTDDSPDIVNNSWGFVEINQCNNEFKEDIEILKNADIAVIFSAGNSGPLKPSSSSPANNQDSFSVGSIDNDLDVSYFSSRGPSACTNDIFPNVVAPGSFVKTTDLYLNGRNTDPYVVVSGTSFSAPHVAGALALLKSAFPEKSMEELVTALESTTTDLGVEGADNDFGSGLIDVKKAYNYIANLPEIKIDKEAYEFPKTILNQSSLTANFIVRNTGYASLNIENVIILNSVDFTILSENCSNANLSHNQTCEINVIFNPSQTGLITTNIIVVSNDPSVPEKIIRLSGIGILEKLKVLSPNSREAFSSGSVVEIKWAGTDKTIYYTIQFSKNGGLTWSNIAKFVTGYSYNWSVPADIYNRNKCLIRVLGYDIKKRLIAKDVSDTFFSINILKISVPFDGDIVTFGSILKIQWKTYLLIGSAYKTELYFTSNNGLTWKKVADINGNPGFFDWFISEKPSKNCFIKLVLRDVNNRVIGIVKNNLPFSII